MSNSWGLVPDNLFGTIVTDRIAQLSGTGGRRGRGIVFLWAAGNENCPIQFTGNVDVPYTDGWGYDAAGNPRWVGVQTARRFRNTLVGLPGVMHVAALASTAQRSHYSNYGTGIDVCAPTSNSHAFWRMTVPGLGVVAPTGEGQRFTVAFGGTSSATPLAAGVAALVISAHPLLSAADVISILRKTASKDLDFTGYARTPPASYDPNPTWDVSPVAPFANGAFVNQGDADGTWSPWFGFGKLDAERAVTEALARRTPPVAGAPVTGSSSPNRQIPDNDATGIEDSITLAGTGQVGRMKVNVDVEHTYIGDLVITLVAPDGSSTVLHNRAGGSQKNLKRQWDSASDGVLAALNGAPLAGPWKLRIRDAAAIDVGRLKQWSLAVEPAGVRAFANTDEAGVPIPENDAGGVTRTMQVDVVGRIVDIAVDLDITHPYIGDVRATLTAPSGQQVVLHDRTGGQADNIITTFRSGGPGGLSALIGGPANGTWQLKVVDLAPLDVGKLNRWGLTLSVA
jgi:subtilisin-like proprotein convertase family protein